MTRIVRIATISLVFCVAHAAAAWAATAPTITVSSVQQNPPGPSATFTLSWGPSCIDLPGVCSYPEQIQLREWDPSGVLRSSNMANASSVTLTRTTPGAWRYQVLYVGHHEINGKFWSRTSNTVTVTVAPHVPVLAPVSPAPTPGQAYWVNWTSGSGDYIYELWESRSSVFSNPPDAQYWPKVNREQIPGKPTGTYWYRARAWNKLPQNGGVSSAWSNVIAVRVAGLPQTPTLFSPLRPPATNGFRLAWTGDANAAIFELQESTTPVFTNPPAAQYWPTTASEPIPPKPAGIFYYRVRGWNGLPEQGGQSGAWSNTVTVQVLSDAEFLDLVARKTFDYFLEATYPNGLTRDRVSTGSAPDDIASVAASGFYLSALTVGAERGWMSRGDGETRALTTLQTLTSGTPTEHGFFHHFLNADGTPSSVPFPEVSSIDTALCIAGALQAGEYFGGQAKTLAEALYRRVEWDWMLDANLIMHQGWTPQSGLFGSYGSFSEAILLYLLGVGSPTHPISAEAFYAFARPKGAYGGPDFVFTEGGQLFVYHYPTAWFDFRNTADALGVNWWQNAIEAVRANQRFAINNPAFGYGQYVWGLTSSDGPYATPQNPYGYQGYGAQPAYYNTHDGTIAPTGIGGSIALAPDIALPSLKQLYTVYGDQIWQAYGFVDAFNPNLGWADAYYLSIDQGPILLMLENYRAGTIWRTFMQNPSVVRTLARARFSGYVPAAASLENFEDGNFWTPETTVGWWDSAGANV